VRLKMTSAPVAILVRAAIFDVPFSSPLLCAWGYVLKQGVVFVKPELAEVGGFSSFFYNAASPAFLVTEHKNRPSFAGAE
jgi:hypothetical protein